MELVLWRDVYHQDPRNVALPRIMAHLTCMDIEAEYLAEKRRG